MKKVLFIAVLSLVSACGLKNYDEKDILKQEKINETIQSELSSNLKEVSMLLKDIYINSNFLNYQFMGNLKQPVTAFITGKDLVIPVLFENIENQIILSIGILINLETNSKQVLVDNLIIEYDTFKKLITKSSSWIEKTENFNNKLFLEKKMNESIEISFPQNNSKEMFESFMIFDGERNLKNLVLRKQNKDSGEIVISFDQTKILYLNEKLTDMYILGVYLDNKENLYKEMENVNNEYKILNKLLEEKN